MEEFRCKLWNIILLDKELEEEERLDFGFVSCKGGGRVRFSDNHILIYSYSQAFGRADHSKAKEIIKRSYPDYEITVDKAADDY